LLPSSAVAAVRFFQDRVLEEEQVHFKLLDFVVFYHLVMAPCFLLFHDTRIEVAA
jgi:hypothetical protein